MRKGKKLFSFIEVTDETPIQKLGLMEQFRLLVVKLSHDDREQLRAESAETQELLTLKANLLEFLYKATQRIREGAERSVTMQISSKFLPVLDEVLDTPSVKSYYKATIIKPDIEYDIDYFLKLTLEVKSY